MSISIAELEREVLNLPPQERERLACAVWESLEGVSAVDPEGIEIALCRDKELESGAVAAINHSEFLRRTRGYE